MIFINLDSLNKVNALTKVCEKYNDLDTDIMYGRYIVNGCSVLGVSSLLGNIVRVCPNTNDEAIINSMIKDLEEIGAWEQKQ